MARAPATAEDLEALETDVLAGFILARAAAGLSDGTISSDVVHLEQVRAWFGRPLWEMEPADADAYFGKVMRGAARGTRLSRAQAIKTYFLFGVPCWVGPGRPAVITPGGFPRPARRTRRACLRAPGAPHALPAGQPPEAVAAVGAHGVAMLPPR
ncbi:hypothetical protein ACFQVD_12675 [Streptosporangium amethystogenes subsp. fukuiense]|uniref:Core-binding (CB) domain-containing protein n=1 Tax=Streptosporangium amethystogenes subsp. fukuiense TaxID=698418 RepID=A0ABW2SZC3_9ACTN